MSPEPEVLTIRQAAANLHDAVGNTYALAQDCPPKIYKALLALRRAITDEAREGGKISIPSRAAGSAS